MLPYYSPFKVAEQFLMLEALFPNRVDLGVGRAPGGDMRTAQAVAAGDYNRGDIFPQQVADLVGLFNGTLPDDHIAHGVLLQPQIDTRPAIVDARFERIRRPARGATRHSLRVRAFHQRAVRAPAWREAYRERFNAGNEAQAVSRGRRVRDLRRHRTGSRRARKSRRPAPRADGLRPERADPVDRARRSRRNTASAN